MGNSVASECLSRCCACQSSHVKLGQTSDYLDDGILSKFQYAKVICTSCKTATSVYRSKNKFSGLESRWTAWDSTSCDHKWFTVLTQTMRTYRMGNGSMSCRGARAWISAEAVCCRCFKVISVEAEAELEKAAHDTLVRSEPWKIVSAKK
jgi:hypothetical protein